MAVDYRQAYSVSLEPTCTQVKISSGQFRFGL